MRTDVIGWLRRTHGWIGMWGAGLALLFGCTGVLLNHRAILKIPLAQQEERTVQLEVEPSATQTADLLAQRLQARLALDHPVVRIREEPPRTVPWGDRSLQQPAHWSINFSTARMNVQADWWSGNRFVTIRRADNNVFATLTNFHKGVGAGAGWILLADTLAGGIILLSLTGLVLWTQLNRRRLVGVTLAATSLILLVVFAIRSM